LAPVVLNAQGNVHKTVTISVVDEVTGKPVEGAEIRFRTLIGKLAKKTNAAGKATFDLYLLGKQSYDWKYTVTEPGSNPAHKNFSSTITLLDSKDVYDYTASLQPTVAPSVQPEARKVSFKIADE